jgi:plastocyanin
MYTSTLLLSLLPVALAQYGDSGSGSSGSSTSSSSKAPTSTASAVQGVTTIKVSNANGDLAFTPDSVNASVGSMVEFVFYPPTHSIAQASFASPCEPLANNTGFFSGAIQTTTGPNTAKVFTIMVNDTKPIWFYCGFPTHCEAGMVGVINAP